MRLASDLEEPERAWIQLPLEGAPEFFKTFRVSYHDSGDHEDWSIDPHNATCRGSHNVVLTHWPALVTRKGSGYCTVTWGPSIMLSLPGTMEFTRAVMLAVEMGLLLETTGERPNVVEIMRRVVA